MTTLAATRSTPGWFTAEDCRLEDFRSVVETPTELAEYPYADEVRENVLVYGSRLRNHVATPEGRRDVQAELARALADGPGIVVFAGAFPDTGVVDRATAVFEALIAEQKAAATCRPSWPGHSLTARASSSSPAPSRTPRSSTAPRPSSRR